MLVPRRVPPKNAKLAGPSFIGHREAVDIFFRHGYYLCFKRQVTTPGFQQIQLLTSRRGPASSDVRRGRW